MLAAKLGTAHRFAEGAELEGSPEFCCHRLARIVCHAIIVGLLGGEAQVVADRGVTASDDFSPSLSRRSRDEAATRSRRARHELAEVALVAAGLEE